MQAQYKCTQIQIHIYIEIRIHIQIQVQIRLEMQMQILENIRHSTEMRHQHKEGTSTTTTRREKRREEEEEHATGSRNMLTGHMPRLTHSLLRRGDIRWRDTLSMLQIH